jgi:hypothetical protein
MSSVFVPEWKAPGLPGRATLGALASSATRARPFLWWLAIAVTGPGIMLRSPLLMALGSGLIGLAFMSDDLRLIDRGGVSAITVYSLSAAVIGFANAHGLSTRGTGKEYLYYLYSVPEHLELGMMLALAGTVIPVLAFRVTHHARSIRLLYSWIPTLRGDISPRHLVVGGGLIAGAFMVLRLIAQLPALGTVTAIVTMIPQLTVFVLARAAMERNIPWALPLAMILAISDAIYAAFFEFLRADVIASFGALTLGALFGARSVRVLKRKEFIPVYVGAVLFVVYFGAFAAARTQAGGMSRLITAYNLEGEVERSDIATLRARQTVLSRLTTFNQLSQIGRVVKDDGFLGGATLEYLGFAFVPRFLWPEKPVIAKGAWFALRIGQANVLSDGQITNSVNMTIPGELYLNFGWLGVVVGCALFGGLVAVLWNRARFWDGARNVPGSAFGFYLLWVWIALSLGPDLQVIVTMIAMYLLFLAGSVVLTLMGPPARR